MPNRKDMVVLGTSLITLFIILEISFRTLGFRQSIYLIDPDTHLVILKPLSRFYWQKECFKNLVKANNFGFHDNDFRYRKDDSIFRIAILGDSYVEALQVPREKTFHKLLEDMLNSSNISKKKIEVYSFGHSGNGTLLNFYYLKNYGIKFKPDLVIDCFLIGNDFRDDSCALMEIYVRQTGDKVVFSKPCVKVTEGDNLRINYRENFVSKKSFIPKLAAKSSFLVWLFERYQILKYKFIQKSLALPHLENLLKDGSHKFQLSQIPVDFQVFLKHDSQEWLEAWQIEERLLKDIFEFCRGNNIKFLLVSLTEGFRVHMDLKESDIFDWRKPERLLGEISERTGFLYLGLTDYFRSRFLREGIRTTFDCDGHWNETGHKWAAEAIFEFLTVHKELLED